MERMLAAQASCSTRAACDALAGAEVQAELDKIIAKGVDAFASTRVLDAGNEARARVVFGSSAVNASALFRSGAEGAGALPAEDPAGGTMSYATCAVVGNSGKLLHRRLGGIIDAHDAVVRVNQAPTKGYEVDVGVKVRQCKLDPNLKAPGFKG